MNSHFLDEAASTEALPFAFEYDGRASDRLLMAWTRTVRRQATPQGELCVVTWSQPGGGLQVEWSVLFLKDYNAAEWKLQFANVGSTKSGVLTHCRSLRHHVAGLPLRVVHAVGGTSHLPLDQQLASEDYRPTEVRVTSNLPRIRLAAADGWSSNHNLPFWMIYRKKDGSGFFYGLGWTGQWQADLDASDDSLTVSAGMQHLHLRLNPGESISQPTVLVGEFAGGRWNGHNALRRVLRDRYTAPLGDEPPLPPVSWNSWFVLQNDISEQQMLAAVEAAAALGIEYVCIDAGWFNVDHPQCGDWRVNERKFPRGLEPVAEAIRKHGMKPGLWFDPERVTSQAYQAFPRKDLLKPAGRESRAGGMGDVWLVDMSLPEAQAWVADLITGYADRLQLGWIRWDMNYPPLAMWLRDAEDDPDRLGWKEIKYVEGLYAAMDRVRQRCPTLLIEWCAGGGRRIDLETLRRTHTLWRSDITGNGDDTRAQLTAGSMWLPGNRLNSNLIRLDGPYDYHCQFGGPLGFGAPLDQLPPDRLATTRRMIAQYRKLRHLLMEDYYPLFQYSAQTSGWDGWQFHDARRGEGFFLILRLENSPYREATIRLHGLERNRSYRLETERPNALPAAVNGVELMDRGLVVRLPESRTSLLVRYWLEE